MMWLSTQLLLKHRSPMLLSAPSMLAQPTRRLFLTQRCLPTKPFLQPRSLLLPSTRCGFLTLNGPTMPLRPTALTQLSTANFSLKMRKVKAKLEANKRVKKYKLKTKKSCQKRFLVVGSLRNRHFKYHAVGHRHQNRNKSHRNLKAAKRRHILDHLADHKKMKRLMPYYKKRRALRM